MLPPVVVTWTDGDETPLLPLKPDVPPCPPAPSVIWVVSSSITERESIASTPIEASPAPPPPWPP